MEILYLAFFENGKMKDVIINNNYDLEELRFMLGTINNNSAWRAEILENGRYLNGIHCFEAGQDGMIFSTKMSEPVHYKKGDLIEIKPDCTCTVDSEDCIIKMRHTKIYAEDGIDPVFKHKQWKKRRKKERRKAEKAMRAAKKAV